MALGASSLGIITRYLLVISILAAHVARAASFEVANKRWNRRDNRRNRQEDNVTTTTTAIGNLTTTQGGQCVERATVGSCFVTGCFLDHGPATCRFTSCKCDLGYCSYDGWSCISTTETTTVLEEDNFSLTLPFNVSIEDPCGAKEYMTEGKFKISVGACLLVKCHQSAANFGASASKEVVCCSLDCAKEVLQRDLRECWEKLKPDMKHFDQGGGCDKLNGLNGGGFGGDDDDDDWGKDDNDDDDDWGSFGNGHNGDDDDGPWFLAAGLQRGTNDNDGMRPLLGMIQYQTREALSDLQKPRVTSNADMGLACVSGIAMSFTLVGLALKLYRRPIQQSPLLG